MTLETITSLDDSRLSVYRDLPHRKWARGSGLFVAEGRLLLERLLEAGLSVESILLQAGRHDEWAERLAANYPIFLAERALLEQLVGFRFHSGVLACARRPDVGKLGLLTQAGASMQPAGDRRLIVVCPRLADPENIGAIARSCLALGADGMLVGRRGADPFSRRALRVSMGAGFRLPIIDSDSPLEDVVQLKQQGFCVIATALDEQAKPLLQACRPEKVALVLGEEAEGIDDAWRAVADQLVTIEMQSGVDSLNVAVAAGIVLHHFLTCSPSEGVSAKQREANA